MEVILASLILAASLSALGIILLRMAWSLRKVDPYPALRQVIVNTRTELAFRGILWERRGDYLVLRQAEMVRAGGETVKMDGEVAIAAGNVDFIQVV